MVTQRSHLVTCSSACVPTPKQCTTILLVSWCGMTANISESLIVEMHELQYHKLLNSICQQLLQPRTDVFEVGIGSKQEG